MRMVCCFRNCGHSLGVLPGVWLSVPLLLVSPDSQNHNPLPTWKTSFWAQSPKADLQLPAWPAGFCFHWKSSGSQAPILNWPPPAPVPLHPPLRVTILLSMFPWSAADWLGAHSPMPQAAMAPDISGPIQEE
jgi:hypothetical protein